MSRAVFADVHNRLGVALLIVRTIKFLRLLLRMHCEFLEIFHVEMWRWYSRPRTCAEHKMLSHCSVSKIQVMEKYGNCKNHSQLKILLFSFSLFPIHMLWGFFWTLAEILSITLHKC